MKKYWCLILHGIEFLATEHYFIIGILESSTKDKKWAIFSTENFYLTFTRIVLITILVPNL